MERISDYGTYTDGMRKSMADKKRHIISFCWKELIERSNND